MKANSDVDVDVDVDVELPAVRIEPATDTYYLIGGKQRDVLVEFLLGMPMKQVEAGVNLLRNLPKAPED